ncbi:MAG: hypothetical protein ACI89X_001550 [Planctomycetota bacterium]|jgi:hypothetical protein
MRNLAIASLWLVVPSLLLAQEPVQPEPLASKAALRQFQERGGDWIAKWHPATGTPSAIYGTGLKIANWRENSLAEGRRHAVQLLKDESELLGLGQSDFQEVIGARMGRTWSFTFDQSFHGIPAIEGRVDVRINMAGVVSMMGSHAWPIPANFNTVPAINANLATAAAWTEMGSEPTGQAPAPRLVIWGDMASKTIAPFFLAWEVSVHSIAANGEGIVGRYYVDAQNGLVLQFENDKHDCKVVGCSPKTAAAPVVMGPLATRAPTVALIETGKNALPIVSTVTLMAWTRIGNDATSTLQNVPLRGITINVPGIGLRTTDVNGEFDIDITLPVTININGLDGTHFSPINGANAPTGSVTVNPGVNATIQLLTSGASTNAAAHTTAAYWTDRTNEWARSILGNSGQMATISNIGVTVNITSTCNAYYTGNTTNYYQAGGGCANTAFSSVIAHEWGHGLDSQYGGISNSNAEGLSEGWGDIIGMYQLDSPLLGSGFQSPGQPLRNGNNSRIWPYSSSSPHGAGQVWMGWAWRFREAMRVTYGQAAVQLTDTLVLSTIVADATTRQQAVLEVFIADDDDGNLMNGTPNYNELSSASIQKGIPYPVVQLVSISHNPLATTSIKLTAREVLCTAAPVSGSINQMRIVFSTGGGNVVRNMHPTGVSDQFLAMLPGLETGVVTYRIEAVHSTGTTVRLPATGDYTYQIDSGNFVGFWAEGFESGGAGWTHAQIATQDDWQVGNPNGKSGTSMGVSWADPQNAAAGSNCYGNDLGNVIAGANWNGAYQPNVNNWLRSPIINCSNRSGVRIRFRRWLTVEEGIYDEASLYCNGQLIWENQQNGHTVDTAWQTVEYLVPWADNNPSVQFEWRLQSDSGLHLGGWNIDEVTIGETIVPASEAELRFTPEQIVQGATMTARIDTPTNARPYLLVVGDSIGPTVVPGMPIIFVGGNYGVLGGITNATGTALWQFPAPNVPTAIGLRFYSQVLTVDSTATNFVVSNRAVNLITQTP